MPFSAELKERRTKAGLSLREAVAKMRERGANLSFSMLSRYERGRGLDVMSLHHARAISRLFRWSMGEMTKKIATETGAELKETADAKNGR